MEVDEVSVTKEKSEKASKKAILAEEKKVKKNTLLSFNEDLHDGKKILFFAPP
jgi:hypothetical protein